MQRNADQNQLQKGKNTIRLLDSHQLPNALNEFNCRFEKATVTNHTALTATLASSTPPAHFPCIYPHRLKINRNINKVFRRQPIWSTVQTNCHLSSQIFLTSLWISVLWILNLWLWRDFRDLCCRILKPSQTHCSTPCSLPTEPACLWMIQHLVPEPQCMWISNVLTNRTPHVKMGEHISESWTISTGAPQGCVLSTLLFSLYTNDYPSGFPL